MNKETRREDGLQKSFSTLAMIGTWLETVKR